MLQKVKLDLQEMSKTSGRNEKQNNVALLG